VKHITETISQELDGKSDVEKIAYINTLRGQIAAMCPIQEPVNLVLWVPAAQVRANSYNPNKVASPEMQLLYESIKLDGYTQPIVVYKTGENNYEIVDGFHRSRVGKENIDIAARVRGYLPIVVIDKPLDERMGSTIRHNRARGTHQIRSMSDIVLDLVKQGWSDDKIMAKLGMGKDEVLRLKQISGLKEAFSNHEFSKSWNDFETRYFTTEKGKAGKTVSNKPKRKKVEKK
jgi:ParB-like chromosome segregation protein Spo0J